MGNRIWKMVKPWCVPLGLTILIYVMLKCVLLVGYVPTASMEPTLPEGSIIVCSRIFRELQVGDIIVFEKDGMLLVKRIAAVAGETVNLTQLIYMEAIPIPVRENPVLTVPEESFFVLGDNTQNSFDSRYWEDPFVRYEDIVAVRHCGCILLLCT